MEALNPIQAAILGLVEGATEFIPVSSTGHLILVQSALGLEGEKVNAFSIFIQLGAILAVVWVYWRKLLDIVLGLPRDPVARRLALNLILATLPAVIIGLPTDDWVEAHLFHPLPVALALVVGGLAILLIERTPRPVTTRSIDDISTRLAVAVGCIQVLALLFPGVSRSGATIMGGLLLGLSRLAATEFSFFLAIPALCGASIVKLYKVRDTLSGADLLPFGTGFVVAFVSALLVIRGLLAFVSRRSFVPFAWYRILLGIVLVVLLQTVGLRFQP